MYLLKFEIPVLTKFKMLFKYGIDSETTAIVILSLAPIYFIWLTVQGPKLGYLHCIIILQNRSPLVSVLLGNRSWFSILHWVMV